MHAVNLVNKEIRSEKTAQEMRGSEKKEILDSKEKSKDGQEEHHTLHSTRIRETHIQVEVQDAIASLRYRN